MIRFWNACVMPQATQMEICHWLFGPFGETSPSVFRHHVMPLTDGRPVIGSVFPTEVTLSIEDVCSLNIHCADFSVVKQLVICKQCHLKNAKLMSVLKIFWKCVLCSVIGGNENWLLWNAGSRLHFAKCRGKQDSPPYFILSNKERTKAQKNSFLRYFSGSGGRL